MQKFLDAENIAIIGASDKKNKIGNILIKNLKNKKNIFPVNPRHKIISGLITYDSVLSINKKIDLAIIAIPADFVIDAVQDCISKKIKNIVIISAGFSEQGEEGRKREEEIRNLAIENKLNILGPNCLGFVNNEKKTNASFAKNKIAFGEVGIISQSGAFVTGLLDVATESSVGFSKIVTLGNKTVLDETDFLKYLGKDPKTQIIGLYLENIKNGKNFYNLLLETTPQKPVLVLKAGNSNKVKEVIMSHTGSMAGESLVAQKAIEDSGGIYFENMNEFWQTLKILCGHCSFRNNEMAIITNAGGPGVLATDFMGKNKELKFYKFSSDEKNKIAKILPTAASINNPIDILGDADSKRYETCLTILSKNKKLGGIIMIITPQAQTDVENILRIAEKIEKGFNLPIIPVLIGKNNPKTFQFPEEAIKGIAKIIKYQNQKPSSFKKDKKAMSWNYGKIKELVKNLRQEKRRMFLYEESLRLMKKYKITSLEAVSVKKPSDLKDFQAPWILKVDDPEIIHKMASGAIVSNIETTKDLQKQLPKLQKKFKNKKIIAQKKIEKGLEIILGIKKDPGFGPVLMCGLGGILTEIFDEKVLWLLPTNKTEIERDLKKSKIAKVFKKEGLKIKTLVKEIEKVGKVGWENQWIEELDINPMFFYSNKKPVAVDIKVKINELRL